MLNTQRNDRPVNHFKWMYIKSIYLFTGLFILYADGQAQVRHTKKSSLVFYTMADFARVKKYDVHVHVDTDKPDFVQQAINDNFRLLTINWDDANETASMEMQQQFSLHQIKKFPDHIHYATTFSIRHFNEYGWQQQTLAYLKNTISNGAIAVKIYKVIGMSLRDKNNQLVMIDNTRFDTIINFIAQYHIPAIGHLGEPKNCWLPANEMTINGDKSYFTKNPKYHMYQHPEFPSYEDQIGARDRMLEKHADLQFVGAHLGSLEWSIDELAKRLDRFPNMAVDMAARIAHLEYQATTNRQNVRDFCIKYQDRLLYATDLGATETDNAAAVKKHAHNTWLHDWKFFATEEKMQSTEFEGTLKGLHLPREVVDKIYRLNAEKWFPGLRKKTSLKTTL
ncbi:hypothetical protein BH11BAC5_BH11BAC5_22240 [soil metagenome]